MNIMVTGSRRWRDLAVIDDALDSVPLGVHKLISGCASGADAIARSLAIGKGWEPWDFWPDYTRYGFAEANLLRNLEMVAAKPDLVLAFPTKGSRGTWHAVNAAKRAGYIEGHTAHLFRSELEQVELSNDL